MATGADQGDDHIIAHLKTLYPGAYCGDAARGLMTKNSRQAAAKPTLPEGDIGMADRHRVDDHLNLTSEWRAQAYRFNRERRTVFVAKGSLNLAHE